jgi:hypothetical protein
VLVLGKGVCCRCFLHGRRANNEDGIMTIRGMEGADDGMKAHSREALHCVVYGIGSSLLMSCKMKNARKRLWFKS